MDKLLQRILPGPGQSAGGKIRIGSRLFATVFGALLLVTGLSVSHQASANDRAVGTLFGAGVGALAGQSFGGRDGAVVGGVVGAVVGSQLAHGGSRHRGGRGGYVEYPSPTIIFGPPIWSDGRSARRGFRHERRVRRDRQAFREGYRQGRRDSFRSERRHQRRWSNRDRW